jgi:hypothetical protein|tara:strand:+ start:5016 stop:5126 length:111 start_codon:yes stop_codon:yes gene_type:complete
MDVSFQNDKNDTKKREEEEEKKPSLCSVDDERARES